MFDAMIKDLLAKHIPPGVMEFLTPEKLKEFSDDLSAYIVNTREALARIEAGQLAILDLLSKGHDDGR